MSTNFLLWFADINEDDPVGTHAKRLAKLTQAQFPVPPGFLITSDSYFTFLKENNLDKKIKQLLSTISVELPDSLMQGEYHIQQLFDQASLSEEFIENILDFYGRLGKGEVILSLHEREAHGRKHTKAQAYNEKKLLKEIKNAWAQMFTGNAMWHRHHRNYDHLRTSAEIIVQKKITGDKTGVLFTIDPHSHEKNRLVIHTFEPHEEDRYVLSKKNFSIIDRTLRHNTNLPKLSHEELLAIANMGKRLEEFLYFPQEIHWAIADKELFIIETKPISTVIKQQSETLKKISIARGKGITQAIATGFVHVIHSPEDFTGIKAHDVLILPAIQTRYLPHLKKVRGVIIEKDLLPPEVIIILKQHGIPTISNVKHAGKQFKNGRIITIHGGKGEIYHGGML